MCLCKTKIQICLCPKKDQQLCTEECHTVRKLNSGKEDSYNFFDILSHNIPDRIVSPKTTKTEKRNTTYAKDYTPKRSSPTKITIPYPAQLIPEGKTSCKTTYKTDFKPFSSKSRNNLRYKIPVRKDNLKSLSSKFCGSSETKSSFVNPASIRLTMEEKLLSQKQKQQTTILKYHPLTNKPLASTTTYSSSYRKPKNAQKSESFKPKVIRLEIIDPIKHLSQYKDDFRCPKKTKREIFKKTENYVIPEIPMESKTTYRDSYTPKPIEKAKRTKRPLKEVKARNELSSSRVKCLCDQNCSSYQINRKPKNSFQNCITLQVCTNCHESECCKCCGKENEIPEN